MRHLKLIILSCLLTTILAGCSAPATSQGTSADRANFAQIFQEEFTKFKSGPGSPVNLEKTTSTASGSESKTLIFENGQFTAEISQLMAKKLFGGETKFLDKAKEFGFETIVFTDGISTWTMSVEKGDWWNVASNK